MPMPLRLLSNLTIAALLMLVGVFAAGIWPPSAHAQVKRCAGPTGELVYTDRNCADVGATDRLLQDPGSGYAPTAPYRGGCSRRLNDLVHGLTNAIESKDVNRLAALYDWAGVSTRRGYDVMTRLDGIVQRPLVDILPIYARPPPIVAEDGTLVDANADGYFPQTTTRRVPTGLRLEQTFTNGNTPARTVFGLRKRLGCWWVSL